MIPTTIETPGRGGKTVVMLASDFPPSSLPSSIRPRLFASHLARFGWNPIVVTVRPELYECPVDPDNERLVAAEVEVIRTGALPAAVARRFGFGDIGIRSLGRHWRALRDLAARRQIDLVFISVPPCVPMLLGRLALWRLGIPYVLDYQDPWVTDAWWKVPAAERPPKWPLAWAMARLLEPWGVGRAAALTGVSMGATDYAATLQPGVLRAEIPFGAEPAEFAFLRANPRKNGIFNPADGNIHLVYTGVVIPGMYPALRVILQAVRALVEEGETLLRLHFVGTSYGSGHAPKVLPLAAEAGVVAIVTETPDRVPYLDSLQLLLDSSVLLIAGTDEPHYTPSKVFPYALAEKPILALVHQASTASALLRATSGCEAVTFGAEGASPAMVPAVVAHLRMLLRAPVPAVDSAKLAPFTAAAMTGRLADVFNAVVQ